MNKIYISFLGVTNYTKCNYYYPTKKNIVKEVRFIQEAVVQLLCDDFGEDDKIIVFVTKAARDKNWYDNGHKTRDGKVVEQLGLQTKLQELNLKSKFEMIEIEEGTNEEEIWRIFQNIYHHIQSGDEVIFDITYGFRSLPMLGVVLIHYAKMLKNITVRAVVYGAMEVLLKTGKGIAGIPLEERDVPILNLTSFALLQQWTNAARDFTLHGNATKIAELTEQKMLGESLEEMTLSFSTVRGKDIVEGNIFRLVEDNIQQIQMQDSIAPLSPLLEKVKQKITPFQPDNLNNGLLAVEWCIGHQLIQQGITMLQEVMTTFVCEILKNENSNLNLDYMLSADRWLVSKCLIIKDDLPESKWKGPLRFDIEKTRTIRASQIVTDVKGHYKTIGKMRNDINHAGFNENPMIPKEFKNELERIYTEIKSIFSKYKL